MYDRAENAGIAVVAGSILPYDTATPEQNARMHEINRWISLQSHRRPRFAFVDTRAAVASPSAPDTLRGSPDRLHPDVEGYRRMAEVLEPALRRALA
jgi:lysophospholipase L1-like esterase